MDCERFAGRERRIERCVRRATTCLGAITFRRDRKTGQLEVLLDVPIIMSATLREWHRQIDRDIAA
jgi:hypothetical protein